MGAGFVLRKVVSRKVARAVLALGLGALILGVVVLGLTVVGWAPFGTWTGAVAAVFLFGAAALVVPFALAAGCCRSSTDSVTLFLLCVGVAGATPVRAQSPIARCAAPNARVSIDHVVLAVRDLDAASDTYAELGFTQKDGRSHANGLRDRHLKFTDGTEIELMSVVGEPGDDMARRYADFLESGEGGAYLALGGSREAVLTASSKVGIAPAPFNAGGFHYVTFPGPGLEGVFFVEYEVRGEDPETLMQHRSGTLGIGLVWLEASPRFGELLSALGATECGSADLPDGRAGVSYGVSGGVVVVTSAAGNFRPRVIGAMLRTSEPVSTGLFGPEDTHGIWLGWRPGQAPPLEDSDDE